MHQIIFHFNFVEVLVEPDIEPEELPFVWSSASIRLLLSIRIGMEKEFSNPKCTKKKLWGKVAAQITKSGGYSITSSLCDSKFRNLMVTYKKNKLKKGTSGESAVHWEYFTILDDVYGTKANVAPSEGLLGGNITCEAELQQENRSPSSIPKKKRRRFDWREEMAEKKLKLLENMWNEKKAIEKAKVAAVNHLVAAFEYANGSASYPNCSRRENSSESE